MIVTSVMRVLVVECLLLQHELMLKFLRDRLLHIVEELCKEIVECVIHPRAGGGYSLPPMQITRLNEIMNSPWPCYRRTGPYHVPPKR